MTPFNNIRLSTPRIIFLVIILFFLISGGLINAFSQNNKQSSLPTPRTEQSTISSSAMERINSSSVNSISSSFQTSSSSSVIVVPDESQLESKVENTGNPSTGQEPTEVVPEKTQVTAASVPSVQPVLTNVATQINAADSVLVPTTTATNKVQFYNPPYFVPNQTMPQDFQNSNPQAPAQGVTVRTGSNDPNYIPPPEPTPEEQMIIDNNMTKVYELARIIQSYHPNTQRVVPAYANTVQGSVESLQMIESQLATYR